MRMDQEEQEGAVLEIIRATNYRFHINDWEVIKNLMRKAYAKGYAEAARRFDGNG